MTAVLGNNGEFSLGSLNAATGWFPASGIVDDIGFSVKGTFVGTVTLQMSDQDDYVKTRIDSIADYTAPTGRLAIPRIASRWFRFIMTAYTSGTAYVGLSKPNIAGHDSIPAAISPQLHSSGPGVDYFITPSGDQG